MGMFRGRARIARGCCCAPCGCQDRSQNSPESLTSADRCLASPSLLRDCGVFESVFQGCLSHAPLRVDPDYMSAPRAHVSPRGSVALGAPSARTAVMPVLSA